LEKKRFVEGYVGRAFPGLLDKRIGREPGRVIDAFGDALDLAVWGFAGVVPEATGRPYHPSVRILATIALNW
jgi:hypothetical protein